MPDYAVVDSLDSLELLAARLLADNKKVGFDVETGYFGPDRVKGALDMDWDSQFVCGFSITNSSTAWARYAPLAHDLGPNLPEGESWEIIKPVLETLPVVAHNMSFEVRNLRQLARKGRGPHIDINICSDSMLESYVLSQYPKHGLKDLVLYEFGHEQATLKSLFPGTSDEKMKKVRFNVLDLTPEVISYACEDALWTLALHERFQPRVQTMFADQPSTHNIYEMEMKILRILIDLEETGHAVDWDSLRHHFSLSEMFKAEMERAAREALQDLSGEDMSTLNLNSAPQMRKVLYETIGLTTTRTTDKGELSTDAIALEALSRSHPAVKKVLEVREVANLTNRLKKWTKEYSLAHDARVHASFNQVSVGSGRFSASEPAIQQLPKGWWWCVELGDLAKDQRQVYIDRHTEGKHYWKGNFRDFLIAGAGKYLLGFDFCLAPGTRVFTSDLRWVQIEDVEVGDELVGFDEDPSRKSKLRRSRVEKTKRLTKDCYRIGFSDGTSVVASEDHYWIATGTSQGSAVLQGTGWRGTSYIPSSRRKWVRTADLVPGKSKIAQWLEPWDEPSGDQASEAAWLGGVLDGEGWIFGNNVGFGQNAGPVLDEFQRVCKSLDLDLGSDYLNKKVHRFYLRGNQNSLKALSISNSVRLKPRAHELWEGKQSYGSHLPSSREVVSLDFLGPQEVIAVQTSTKTFIAEGLLSHNCQIELRVLAGLSQEPTLLDAFQRGEDPHSATASMMLSKPLTEVLPEDRQTGKTINFGLAYQMGPKLLAEQLAISVEAAKELFDLYNARLPKVHDWVVWAKREGQSKGYITTHFGRKWTLWDLQSSKEGIRAKGQRLCVNGPVQGCLPPDTRVLTRKGWNPIGDFIDGEEVWTGAEWATAVRLDRGLAERVRVHLSDGRTFDCDERHKFLVENGAWPEWCHVDDLKGRALVRDEHTDWGEADDLSVEDWYWAGRFSGDGHLTQEETGHRHVRWGMSFHAVKEADDVERFIQWLDAKDFSTPHSKRGYTIRYRDCGSNSTYVRGMTPAAVAWWQQFGWVPSRRGSSSIPAKVFTVDRVRRQAFWDGRFDADGHQRTRSTKVTTAVYSEAQDLLRLAQTLGMTGKVGQANVLVGRATNGGDHVFWEVYLHSVTRSLEVTEVEHLGLLQTMFTLSVDHPRHSFSSEGLISKNTAADLAKRAMIRSQAVIDQMGWHGLVVIINNLHDALTYEVDDSVDPNLLRKALTPAVTFPNDPALTTFPKIEVDWELGQTWGSSQKWEDEEAIFDGQHWRIALGSVPEPEITQPSVPVLVPDPVPEVSAELVIDVDHMPTAVQLDRFRLVLGKRPGSAPTLLRTPEGEVRMSTGLSEAERDVVSLALGGARLYHAAIEVDDAELLRGIAL